MGRQDINPPSNEDVQTPAAAAGKSLDPHLGSSDTLPIGTAV